MFSSLIAVHPTSPVRLQMPRHRGSSPSSNASPLTPLFGGKPGGYRTCDTDSDNVTGLICYFSRLTAHPSRLRHHAERAMHDRSIKTLWTPGKVTISKRHDKPHLFREHEDSTPRHNYELCLGRTQAYYFGFDERLAQLLRQSRTKLQMGSN